MVNQVLRAVALAMGVATLVLSALGSLQSGTAITLLAIGLTCMGVVQLRD